MISHLFMGQPRPLFVYFQNLGTQFVQKKLLASAVFKHSLKERNKNLKCRIRMKLIKVFSFHVTLSR